MRYVCGGCRIPEIGDVRARAAQVAGRTWWTVDRDHVISEVVHRALLDGYCGQHAGLLAELVDLEITIERGRHITPGTVEIVYRSISTDPFEMLPNHLPRRGAEAIVDRVTRFVAGSVIGASVEIDLSQKRLRLTLQLDDPANPANVVIESHRLVHITASELASSLCNRKAIDRAR